jgi:hypothetical protein
MLPSIYNISFSNSNLLEGLPIEGYLSLLHVWDSALSNSLFKNSLFIFLIFVVVLVMLLLCCGKATQYTRTHAHTQTHTVAEW